VTLPTSAGFQGFLMAGFECASHRPRHGRRLDLTAATGHQQWALTDYCRAREQGFLTVRDGLRWHLVEPRANCYDFSSVLPMVRAAHATGIQVIWDLFHFGFPDDLDLFSAAFVDRLGRLAREFTRLLVNETGATCYITPINEPSYLSWAAGEVAYMHPFRQGSGAALKRHLLTAYVGAIEAIRSVQSSARIVTTDPLISLLPHSDCPERAAQAAAMQEAQFEFRDLLAQAGPDSRYLDIVGACYYKANQWYERGEVLRNIALELDDPKRVPLCDLLAKLFVRYKRPLFLAETSAELDDRRVWAQLVSTQVEMALAKGVPVEGICWYPAIDHLGWDDDRPCHHGIWGSCDVAGARPTSWSVVQALRDGCPTAESPSLGDPRVRGQLEMRRLVPNAPR
jgi:hypothetical protein